MNNFDFEQTRPFCDAEVPSAIQQIVNHPLFASIVHYLYPETEVEEIRRQMSAISSVKQFQQQVMYPAIQSIIANTTSGLTYDGMELLHKNNHLFIANHRDIVLDAAFLDMLLVENGMDTCQITFGSNLMKGDMIVNIGKLNKMFRIVRDGNPKEFYNHSMEVSAYMRHVITDLNESVWIAQRNGRTKNGLDKTEPAVLKMFSLSSELPFVENLSELNITPVAISYEYEPCDFLKAKELAISHSQTYVKSENEDLNSILTGIQQRKGKVHIAVTPPITQQELQQCNTYNKNAKFEKMALLIDQRIRSNRKLYETHYIAYDLLHGVDMYAQHYTAAQKAAFIEYKDSGLASISTPENKSLLEEIFLKIYANNIEEE